MVRLSPDIFLATAEKYNLAEIWTVDHRTCHGWLARESACSHWPIRIAINLSAQSILNQSMVKYIIDHAELNGIDPKQVCFEITETAVIANLTAATGFMLTLRGCGFRFSLDDFGSGLASFAYMKKMPVDYLKIDGAFMRDILFDPIDRTMVGRSTNWGICWARRR
jgi:EAL domain-containing protein (putative c-di-GMP-specific phosphodiesterase class I)